MTANDNRLQLNSKVLRNYYRFNFDSINYKRFHTVIHFKSFNLKCNTWITSTVQHILVCLRLHLHQIFLSTEKKNNYTKIKLINYDNCNYWQEKLFSIKMNYLPEIHSLWGSNRDSGSNKENPIWRKCDDIVEGPFLYIYNLQNITGLGTKQISLLNYE